MSVMLLKIRKLPAHQGRTAGCVGYLVARVYSREGGFETSGVLSSIIASRLIVFSSKKVIVVIVLYSRGVRDVIVGRGELGSVVAESSALTG
jgi:hypothetical protein